MSHTLPVMPLTLMRRLAAVVIAQGTVVKMRPLLPWSQNQTLPNSLDGALK